MSSCVSAKRTAKRMQELFRARRYLAAPSGILDIHFRKQAELGDSNAADAVLVIAEHRWTTRQEALPVFPAQS